MWFILSSTLFQNKCMQQPLCHFYFLTVMEYFWTTHLSQLVNLAEHIQKQLNTAEGGEEIILWVELQAVGQVLIQRLAEHSHPLQIRKFGDVQSCVKEINKLELSESVPIVYKLKLMVPGPTKALTIITTPLGKPP